MEQLKDVYSHFILYYGSDIPAMREAKKKRKENEGDGEGERADVQSKQKMPAKRDLYTICKQAGLSRRGDSAHTSLVFFRTSCCVNL